MQTAVDSCHGGSPKSCAESRPHSHLRRATRLSERPGVAVHTAVEQDSREWSARTTDREWHCHGSPQRVVLQHRASVTPCTSQATAAACVGPGRAASRWSNGQGAHTSERGVDKSLANLCLPTSLTELGNDLRRRRAGPSLATSQT